MNRFDGTAADYIEVDVSGMTLPATIRELFIEGGATAAEVEESRYDVAIGIVAVDGPGTLTLKNTRGQSRGPMTFAAGEFNQIGFTTIEAASGVTTVKVFV